MWHHCPGKTNPAGIRSRGELPESLENDKLWWNGPRWLKNPKCNRLNSDVLIHNLTELFMVEAKRKQGSDNPAEKTCIVKW